MPPFMSQHYDVLEEIVQDIKSDNISKEEFLATLQELEDLLNNCLQNVNKVEIPKEIEFQLTEELKVGTAGIKLFLEAIKELRMYPETKLEIYLDRGLLMAKDANARLNEAVRMNWETFRNLQETFEELLRAQIEMDNQQNY
jgi:hypothetical protein